MATLRSPREIGLEVLQGKTAGHGFHPATLTALSNSSAVVRIGEAVAVFDNIRLRLPAESGALTDVFAKVTGAQGDGSYAIQFTSVSDEAQGWFEAVLYGNTGTAPDGVEETEHRSSRQGGN
jgi:hypothetical protein